MTEIVWEDTYALCTAHKLKKYVEMGGDDFEEAKSGRIPSSCTETYGFSCAPREVFFVFLDGRQHQVVKTT